MPLAQIKNYDNPEIIEVDDEFYEIQGYSDIRKAYWVEKVVIESMADNLEKELEDYIRSLLPEEKDNYEQRMGNGES